MSAPALVLGAAGTGLVAGLFLAFSLAVMPALRVSDDATLVAVMQRINVAIVDPGFLVLLMGTPIALVVATLTGPQRPLAGVALALHLLALGVTGAINIPLNEALARVGGSADDAALAAARRAFERRWNRAHSARTMAVTASFATCLVALQAG